MVEDKVLQTHINHSYVLVIVMISASKLSHFFSQVDPKTLNKHTYSSVYTSTHTNGLRQ